MRRVCQGLEAGNGMLWKYDMMRTIVDAALDHFWNMFELILGAEAVDGWMNFKSTEIYRFENSFLESHCGVVLHVLWSFLGQSWKALAL